MSYNEWDKLSSVAVALSLGLDWLFPYVTSYKFGNITFTKFIAIPLVLLSFILQHEKYLKLFFKPTYFVFTICFLFGSVR